MPIPRLISLLGLLAWPTTGLAEGPRPAVTLRFDQPERQARAIIDLFRGSRAPHPAAALAAWKRASREPNRLGKPLEALIAAINPAMAGELRLLDGAEFALWFEPERGRPDWGACLPGDDGSFAALATALVLSGGAAEGPMDGLAVDRLGPPGSALMARSPRALLVAGSRSGLREARIRSSRPNPGDRDPWHRPRFAADPRAFEGSKSLTLLRLNAIAREADGPITGHFGLVGSTFRASLALGTGRPADAASVLPEWLEWLPIDRAMAAFAVAIDPAPAHWDSAFRLAGQVEKVDPALENLAPLRLRLELAGRALGIRLDGDVLPHLAGLSGWIGGDGRAVDRAALILHLDSEAAVARIFDRVKPPPYSAPIPGEKAGAVRGLGRVQGRAIRLQRFGRSLLATWGDGVAGASLEARGRPDRSARSLVEGRPSGPTSAIVATWPARVPGLLPGDTPLSLAVAEAPPVVWSGAWGNPGSFRIEGEWGRLDALVKRFLDLIPQDPPPDR